MEGLVSTPSYFQRTQTECSAPKTMRQKVLGVQIHRFEIYIQRQF